MKIGIVTYHFVNNFGAALQAYALMKTIEQECDSEVEVIDYRHWFIRFTDAVRILPITTNLKEIISGLKTISLRMGRLEKFSKFHNLFYKMTEKYTSPAQLRELSFDKYVCGSDQIWNPVVTLGVAESYFLGFEKSKEKKLSYAPSFGVSRVKPVYEKKMAKYIGDIGAISVRETDGIEIVRNLTGRDAVQLIDPTFLLCKEEWSEIAVEPNINGKYILLYIMQRNEMVYDYAKKIKEKYGLPIVEISRYGYQPSFVDEVRVDVGPREWVGLIKNAEFVCTNSFHGMAFSIIFEKDFFLIPSKKFNSRMDSLMKVFKIEKNYDLENDTSLVENYDREETKKIVQMEREKAIRFLRTHINESGE